MTRSTRFRRWPVKKHGFLVHGSYRLVATVALHVAMRTLQSKRRLSVVVEQRWLPSRAVVTSGTRRYPCFRKLLAMNIRVACLALRRRCLELHVDEPDSRFRWFMAIYALHGLMGAAQRKSGLGMIEAGEFSP